MNLKQHLDGNPIFGVIAESAAELGFPAYVIGGYTRDLLLKRPCKDIDVVCQGSGIALAKKVASKLENQPEVAVFKNFGTAMIHQQGIELEFVGARKESYRRESRKPIVEDGTLEDDQKRRDFTINAMGISLNQNDFGQLIDPFDGMNALKKKMLTTPLDPFITFSDDPLRMMRAVRFASQLGFDIASETFDAIQQNKERLSIVSAERVTEEFNKIILSNPPSYGFKLLYHAGLLDIIFPEFVALKGKETKNGQSHKDNFYHTLQVLDNLSENTDNLWLRWSAILHDIAKPATKRYHPKAGWTFHGHEERGARMVRPLFKRFRLPLNEKMKKVEKLVRLHLRPIAVAKEHITDSAIRRLLFEAGDDVEALMMLCRADITSKNDRRVKRYLNNFNRLEKRMYEVEESDRLRSFQPVITGEVIMEAFGLKPSRKVGDIKDQVREAILDGEIRNEFSEAHAYMVKVGKGLGLKPVKPPSN